MQEYEGKDWGRCQHNCFVGKQMLPVSASLPALPPSVPGHSGILSTAHTFAGELCGSVATPIFMFIFFHTFTNLLKFLISLWSFSYILWCFVTSIHFFYYHFNGVSERRNNQCMCLVRSPPSRSSYRGQVLLACPKNRFPSFYVSLIKCVVHTGLPSAVSHASIKSRFD